MQFWQVILLACGVAVAAALVFALAALARVARRAEGVLAIVERELGPLIGQAHGLTEDLRGLTRQASREVERAGAVIDRLRDVADGVARVVSALGALSRAGQLVGMAAAIRKGVDVFVQRFKQGDGHG